MVAHESRSVSEAGRSVAGRRAEPGRWIIYAARLGFAAKAVLYFVVGLLALQAARGSGGRTTGSRGALSEFLSQPFGTALLYVIALGMAGYALWRVIEALTDPDRHGTSPKGAALRAGFLLSGITHAALSVEAARLATTRSRSAGGGGAESWTARALDAPFGEWLVILTGAGIVGYGLYQLRRAFEAKLDKKLRLSLHREARLWAVRVSRVGIGARGVVFVMIGLMLAKAGRDADASQAGGVGDALRALSEGPYGRWILGGVAAGLIAYSVYEVIRARFRRIEPG